MAAAWNGWDHGGGSSSDGGGSSEPGGPRCLSLNVIGWSGAAANIVLDVATLALPMPELFALSMSRRKKVQIIGMFALGCLYVPSPCPPLHNITHCDCMGHPGEPTVVAKMLCVEGTPTEC